MKKSNIIRVAWIFVITITIVTLSISSFGLLKGSVVEYFIIAEADGFVGLIILGLTERLNEPAIIIHPCNKLLKVGFSVRVKNRSVNDAKVRCNDVALDWEDLEDHPFPSTKLQVGASPPAYFFPFKAEITECTITKEGQVLSIYLYQNKSKYNELNEPKPIVLFDAQTYFTVPRGTFQPTHGKTPEMPHFEANIRITGDEIGEPYSRFFDVCFWPVFTRKQESDKFEDIEFSGFGFSIVEKGLFRKKKYDYDVDFEQCEPELLRYNFRMRKKNEESKVES